jgi:hypothetical protein
MHVEKRNAYKFLVGKREGNIPLGRLREILKKYDGVVWTELIWLRIRTCGGLL